MTKWSEQYPSKYLKADDLPAGRELRVTIDYVERQAMPDDPALEKPVLFFRGKTKGLILNVTNGNELAAVLGDDMDAWQGKPVVIYRTTALFAGRRVGAIRLRVAGTAEPAAARRQAAPVGRLTSAEIEAEVAAADDDIPF